jgi:hypothetical protein
MRGFLGQAERFGVCKTLGRKSRLELLAPTVRDTNSDIMASIDQMVARMKRNPTGVRFRDLSRVCDHYFGTPRQASGSHRVYRTPWQGDPRINIQDDHGKAKAYQVRQVLAAIERLGDIDEQD